MRENGAAVVAALVPGIIGEVVEEARVARQPGVQPSDEQNRDGAHDDNRGQAKDREVAHHAALARE
jgi:hypothetical protein